MALNGIIIEKNKKLKSLIKSDISTIWNINLNITTNKKVKNLLKTSNLHSVIVEMVTSKKVNLFSIHSMMVNGNYIKIRDLYSDLGEVGPMVLFYNDYRDCGLITMDARSITEIEAVGYDSYQHCRVPVIVTRQTVNNIKTFCSPNLC